MISQNGVAGTSHRKVAEAADVPLGSMTYHFTGMEDLLHEAFSRFAHIASEQFEERLAAAHDAATAKQAIASAISHTVLSNQRDLVLHELYTWRPRARLPRHHPRVDGAQPSNARAVFRPDHGTHPRCTGRRPLHP